MRFVLPTIPGIGVAPQFASLNTIVWECNETNWVEIAFLLQDIRDEENQ